MADPSDPRGDASGSRRGTTTGRDRVIFALDYPTLDEALAAARSVAGEVGVVKVGLELFCRHGAAAVSCGDAAGAPVFLDLKLCDIPATVGRAVANLRHLAGDGVRFVTVHASGGEAMLRAAVEAAEGALEIVAVTVLTSLDAHDLEALGIHAPPAAQVERLAKLAFAAGVRTFVCSPVEAETVRAALGDAARIITPGVRPAGADVQDQKRVTTPRDAMLAGADMLVVGRPIREADDPVAAARGIAAEIAEALEAPC